MSPGLPRMLKLVYIILCTVFRDGMTAPLLSPGTGIFKPPMVGRRHDTDRRWRQLTKLPRPFPQYPPFTLRYGKSVWFSPSGESWRSRHYLCLIQSFRFTARTLDTILLRYLNIAGSRRVRDRSAFRMSTAPERET